MTTTAIVLAMLTVAPSARPLESVDSPGFARRALGPGAPCAGATSAARGSARFVLVDSTGRRSMDFGDGNLVFCRTTSATMVWIRFAKSPVNDGADGPHLDIDVCHLSSGGSFAPMEARAQPCPGGMTWAAWWHEGSEAVYANRATSTPCVLSIEVEAAQLRGRFSCHGLVSADGTKSVDLVDGWFECLLKSDNAGVEPIVFVGFPERR